RALAALKDLLKNSRVVSVRQQVAGILGSAPEEALQELADTARNDTDAGVRAVAIESLSHAPASESLMAILADLQRNAEDAAVRSAALTAEMQMRVAAPEQWLTVDYLSRMLAQREDDATAQLQMLLVQEKKGLPALIKVLETAPDPVARAAAACSISLICAGTNPRQQEFARLALTVKKESIPEPGPANLEGLKPLERALARDPSPEVRAMAAQGLGYLGQESSAPLLGKALHDPSEEVRWWAALALITVPAEAALKDLSHAAGKDPSARVREAAVRALGWIKGEAPLRPLVRATADMHASVRQAAATELGRFRQEIARDALIALFEDPSEDVRWAAVLAVGEMRDREAAPALVKALRDPSPMVSNAAERALQRMGIGERRFGTREEET
ncbi:MAG: HEAT repeat domain-containing protein, partial [Armatimonadota bacterium]